MKKIFFHFFWVMTFAILFMSITSSPTWSLSRTSWQMHDGLEVSAENPLGLLEFDCTPSRHGDICEYSVATIPPEGDSGWGAAPDGDIINFSIDSRVCDAPDTCSAYGDFTYFQTFVDIPENTVLTEFTISFSGMDDGSRVTIFNSNYTDGIVVEGSYVYLGGTGTTDLKDYVVNGEVNRVVITQVDDCCRDNNLREASVVLNGDVVEVVDPDPDCPITQNDVTAAYEQGVTDGQAGCESNTVVSMYGDKDGFGIGFAENQTFSGGYPDLAKDDLEDVDTLTDEWLEGDQYWTQTYDISDIRNISSATIEIMTLGQGWQGISELYIDSSYVGDLTNGDSSGEYLETNWARLDTFDISEFAEQLKGANTITIDTYRVDNDDKWAMDYCKLTITDIQDEPCEDNYDDGYEAGKQYCIENPEACGIIVSADTQAAYNEGYSTGYQDGRETCQDGIRGECVQIDPATLDLSVGCAEFMGTCFEFDMILNHEIGGWVLNMDTFGTCVEQGDDLDGDGYHADEDCDDTNAAINPGATEIPGNSIDEDCVTTIFD